MSDTRAGRLTVVDDTQSTPFNFHFELLPNGVTNLAPNVVKRSYSTTYATAAIALSGHEPREFRSIGATELSVEFDIVGGQQRDVEQSLRQLRTFMKKDRRTGEPPDIVFSLGQKSWTVRIDHMEHVPRLWNASANEQRVRVTLSMHTTSPE